MSESLEDLVERTIDWVIRSFRPDDSDTFNGSDAALQKVEMLLSSAEPGSIVLDLLVQVRATRIFLAAEIGDAEAVVRQSESFLRTCSPTRLDFFNVQNLRLRALHTLGHHSDELREALEAAKSTEVRSEDFVLLLEGLAKRHPGSFASDAFLQKKMSTALRQLVLCGYTNLPTPDQVSANLEQAALDAVAEFRRVNRAKAEELLSGGKILNE
jgi:hypothetical protein